MLVATPNLPQTTQLLADHQFGRATVMLPELISIAGLNFATITESLSRVTETDRVLTQTSLANPEATFVYGTVQPENEQLYNVAKVIQNGQVTAISYKRYPTPGEIGHFTFNLDHPLVSLDDSQLAICKDFLAAKYSLSLQGQKTLLRTMQQLGFTEEVAQKYSKARFLAEGIRELLVISCWGVGAMRGFSDEDNTPTVINGHYQEGIRQSTVALYRLNPDLERIIVCDRAPTFIDTPATGFFSTHPLSGVFFRPSSNKIQS